MTGLCEHGNETLDFMKVGGYSTDLAPYESSCVIELFIWIIMRRMRWVFEAYGEGV